MLECTKFDSGWLELLPDPTVGAYIAAPDALAGFNWPFF